MSEPCCVSCAEPTPAVLTHNDVGYCVWHYRMLPDSILRKPHEAHLKLTPVGVLTP